jgi:hypothetical protein
MIICKKSQGGCSCVPQTSNSKTKDKIETCLSYIVEVQPKRWMPVALIEGVLGHEITCNLISVRNVALRKNSL